MLFTTIKIKFYTTGNLKDLFSCIWSGFKQNFFILIVNNTFCCSLLEVRPILYDFLKENVIYPAEYTDYI